MEILTCGCYVIALSKNTCGILLFVFFTCRYDYLKAHFHPWCNARREPISCDSKFQDYWKPGSKIVFLKSYPVHIVNCFMVNTLTVRHFTVSLQYFEFLSSKVRREFFFLSDTLGSLHTLLTGSAKRTTFEFFHSLEALEDSK